VGSRHLLTLAVDGRRLRVAIDGVTLPPATLDARLARGALGFGLAPRGTRSVAFTALSVVAAAPVGVQPPPGRTAGRRAG
jgi:hypothetical protein